jgi:hypothetical protein
MEEGLIFGAQTTQLFEDKEFGTKLNSTEIRVRKTFGNGLRILSKQ